MDPNQKEKLTRYLRNAQPFLWGIIPGNKKVVLATLRENLKDLGEDAIKLAGTQKPTYSMLTDSLLANLGIEKVIREIVIPQVRRQFADRPGALEFLRSHWLSGTLPRWQTLQTLRAPRSMKQRLLEAAHPSELSTMGKLTGDILDAFVEVNNQYNYVHGWTVFAGLWFEEIEPLLKETDTKDYG
jgi:hypothetical protein